MNELTIIQLEELYMVIPLGMSSTYEHENSKAAHRFDSARAAPSPGADSAAAPGWRGRGARGRKGRGTRVRASAGGSCCRPRRPGA